MPIPILLPKFSEQIDESEIVQWLKREGETVRKGDPICEVTTDKVNMEVEAPADGTLYGVQYPAGAMAPVTGVIGYILRDGESPPAELPSSPVTKPESSATPEPEVAPPVGAEHMPLAPAPTDSVKVRATPAARRAARLHHIRLDMLTGTGPRGRIQKADVEASLSAMTPPQIVESPIPSAARTVVLSGKRRIIARRMQASIQTAPHIYVETHVNADRIEAMRMALKARGERVSVTAIVVKACAVALRRFPDFNATLEGETVSLWPDIHIAVAVAEEGGLTAPVIRRVDQCSLSQIQHSLDDLVTRARANTLQRDDLSDGTFSVSNLGMYGVSRFTAIINPPQVAILAVGEIRRQFVPDVDDQPLARSMMTLVLSVDHRWIDGAQAAEFLQYLRGVLEEPALLAW